MDAEVRNPPVGGCQDEEENGSLPAEEPPSGPADPQASVSNGGEAETEKELVELKVIWNKNKYDLKFPLDSTGAELKLKIHSLTGEKPPLLPRRRRRSSA